MDNSLQAAFERMQRRALIAGIVLLAASIVDGIRAPEQFFRSYLLGFIFWVGFPLGCCAFLMIHYLTSGNWGLPIKRPLEAGLQTFPLMIALVIPLLFGLTYIFSWAHPNVVAADPVLQTKHAYLNSPFFIAREVLYFTIWFWLAHRLNRWSWELDRTGDAAMENRLERLSGPGLVLYGLTVTFFSIDWVMSLEPHWSSTIFGMIFMTIQIQLAIAMAILVARLLGAYEPVSTAISPSRFNDLGNLLLTFVMLWAYLGFSQFLIIWSGNLIQEIPWYLARAQSGWAAIALALIVFYFAIPFFLLLMRNIKRRITVLATLCGFLIFMNFVDVYWMIVPAFHANAPRFYLLDALLPLGMGCLWVATFISQLKRGPLLPLHDPRFAGVLEHGD